MLVQLRDSERDSEALADNVSVVDGEMVSMVWDSTAEAEIVVLIVGLADRDGSPVSDGEVDNVVVGVLVEDIVNDQSGVRDLVVLTESVVVGLDDCEADTE